MSVLVQLLAVLGAAVVVFAILWAIQTRTKDAGVVDVGWSGSLGLAAIFCAATGAGDDGRRVLVAVMGGVWGLRLAYHLLTDRVLRSSGTHTHEDGRYLELRRKFGSRINAFLFWFFQAQAVSVALLAAPFALAASDAGPLGWVDYAAAALWVVGLVGESIADHQLKVFKREPGSKGKTCRAGLWRYSRHPNYFFEWLMWCSFAVLALGASWGGLALLAPLTILILVTKVTGIPPTEKRSILSRGDDYRRYQQETSAFFPWFPRRLPPATPLASHA